MMARTEKNQRIFSILFFSFLLLNLAGCAAKELLKSEEVQTMREYAEDEKLKKQFLNEQNENFKKLKKAIGEERLKKGLLSREVSVQFGNPVVINSEDKQERWVYKGRGDWFKAPKVYLFFNEKSQLENWQCLRTNCAAPK